MSLLRVVQVWGCHCQAPLRSSEQPHRDKPALWRVGSAEVLDALRRHSQKRSEPSKLADQMRSYGSEATVLKTAVSHTCGVQLIMRRRSSSASCSANVPSMALLVMLATALCRQHRPLRGHSAKGTLSRVCAACMQRFQRGQSDKRAEAEAAPHGTGA